MDREVELREFVSARGAALSRAAYLLTGDHQAAEDLVQDTYVVLVRRWQKSGTVDPDAYVRRILYSRFVDGWRRRRLLELPWASPPDADGGDDSGRGRRSGSRSATRSPGSHRGSAPSWCCGSTRTSPSRRPRPPSASARTR